MASKSTIEVEGRSCKVLDNLGWRSSAGHYAKEVELPDGTARMAVKPRGGVAWRFWTAADRLGGGGDNGDA